MERGRRWSTLQPLRLTHAHLACSKWWHNPASTPLRLNTISQCCNDAAVVYCHCSQYSPSFTRAAPLPATTNVRRHGYKSRVYISAGYCYPSEERLLGTRRKGDQSLIMGSVLLHTLLAWRYDRSHSTQNDVDKPRSLSLSIPFKYQAKQGEDSDCCHGKGVGKGDGQKRFVNN